MRIFLGFRKTQLGLAMGCHPFAQGVADLLLRVGRGHEGAVRCGIIDHSQQRGPFRARTGVKAGKVRRADGGQNLARPV